MSNKLEEIRSESDAFFNTANLTDVHLLYSPSQIALAAIWHCAVKLKKEIREHIENFLCQDNPEKAEKLIQRLEGEYSFVLSFLSLLLYLFLFIISISALEYLLL